MILALDPAESTGYCIVEAFPDREDISHNRDAPANVICYGHINIEKLENIGDRCLHLMEQVKQLITTYHIVNVVVEDYFFAHKTAKGSNNNPAFRTAIYIQCRLLGIDYTIVNPMSWKKHVAGYVTCTKQMKQLWGKEKAKKVYIQDALWKRRRIRFPNHSISTLTDKPISLRYDEVDAVGQAIYYCEVMLNYKNVTVCDPRPDVPGFKSIYVYQ